MSPLKHRNCLAPNGNTKVLSHVEILIEPREVELDSETSTDEPSCDYTALRRRSRHSWTLEEREALCILRRWYCNSWKELAKIFNGYLAGKSQFDSLPELTGSALSMQFLEMQRHRVKSEAFESVFIETLFADESCAWTDIRRDLEQTARAIAIPLRRKAYEDRQELLKICEEVPKSMKRKKIMSCPDSVLGSFAYKSDGGESGPATPTKRPRYLTPSPTPPKGSEGLLQVSPGRYDSGATEKQQLQYKHIPATPQSLHRLSRSGRSLLRTVPWKGVCVGPNRAVPIDGNDLKLSQVDQLPRPRIVFRFYDNNSSGVNAPTAMRAGLFQNSRKKVSPPPDIDSEAFREEAAKHFSWIREPTPFISMYESILPVLHRGLLSSIDASIAVIDLHTVSRSQQRNQSRVYAAGHVIKRLGLRQEVYGYRGRSEWLVWGIIGKDAIITTFKIEHLRKFLAGSPDVCIVLRFPEIESSKNANEYRDRLCGNANQVSRACGRVVGKLLAFIGIPPSHIDYTARKIARDWQLDGNTSEPRLRRYLEGVELGLQGIRAELRPSTQAKGKQGLAKYLEQVNSGLQRKGAGDGPSKQRRAKPGMTRPLQQVDAGSQRKGAEKMLSKQGKPKPQMTEYLKRVDSGLERKSAKLTLPRHGSPRPRLASYLERVDLGLRQAEEGVTDKCAEPIQGRNSEDFLLRRRHIEAVCQGR